MARRVKRRKGFTRLSAKRQITLPVAVVERAGIKPGEELAVDVDERGRVIISRPLEETIGDRRRRAVARVAGALAGVWPDGALEDVRERMALIALDASVLIPRLNPLAVDPVDEQVAVAASRLRARHAGTRRMPDALVLA